ncbi:MAG: hypothetical protein E7Z74_02075 [Methanobrevibacter millerae]|uniref:Polymorphic outer membrane protein repeat-containing protein n=1 Tax=Methanobrevibacter millerae TaxID=230361 RepID=A0A8T3VHI5_9EURY|nr:hypothetical protein [Methanobrevibacter millerae]
MKKYFVCLFIILLFIIPIGFASDNYASLDSQDSFVDENLIISDNIYFDSSATDDGNGTLDSPYKSFSADKIVDDSVVHFANGEYNLDQSKIFKNLTIIGQSSNKTILNGFGNYLVSDGFLSISSLTLNNISIKNNNELFVYDSILKNNHVNGSGGAINVGHYASLLEVYNSTFINNSASYAGGAICVDSNASKVLIQRSKFINNTAGKFGGAVFIQNNPYSNILDSEFVSNVVSYGMGGSIYSNASQLTVKYSIFNSSKASYGGAIYDENSTSSLNHVLASNNVATYAGGAVYKKGGALEVNSSYFTNNVAEYGDAIFNEDSSSFIVKNSYFISNEANSGKSIYGISNQNNYFAKNVFFDNSLILKSSYFDSYVSSFEPIEVNVLKEIYILFSLDKILPDQINDFFKFLMDISMSKSKLNMQSSHSNGDNYFGFNLIDYIIQMDSDGNYQFILKYGKTSLFAELADLKSLSYTLSIDDLNIFIKDTFNFDNLDNSINHNAGFSNYLGEIPYLINFAVDDSCANIKNPIFDASIAFNNSIVLLKTSFVEFSIDFINFDTSIVIIFDDSISTVEIPFSPNGINLLKFNFA